MRPTLILLSSLALATAANAGIAVSASVTNTTTLTKDASVVLGDLEFHDEDFLGGTIESDPLGEYALATGRPLLNSFDGTTFSIQGAASASLDALDFDAVRGEGKAQAAFYAYYSFTLTNTGAATQTVHFDVSLRLTGSAVASPYADATDYGAYGYFNVYGGIFDYDAPGGLIYDLYRDTFNDGNPVALDRTYVFGRDFTIEAGETQAFSVEVSPVAQATYTPVPEPASFAALAVGGLGLLRRRKR